MTRAVRSCLAVLLGALTIYGGTLLSVPVPGSPVPITGQTIGVLLAGVLLGPARGGAAVLVYLLLGALGLPVFSGGTGGLDHLFGTSLGYFIGFLLAATVAGEWAFRGWTRKAHLALSGMILCHVVILICGWLWLQTRIGPGDAFTHGVAPFLVGGLVKSLIVGLIATVSFKILGRPRRL